MPAPSLGSVGSGWPACGTQACGRSEDGRRTGGWAIGSGRTSTLRAPDSGRLNQHWGGAAYASLLPAFSISLSLRKQKGHAGWPGTREPPRWEIPSSHPRAPGRGVEMEAEPGGAVVRIHSTPGLCSYSVARERLPGRSLRFQILPRTCQEDQLSQLHREACKQPGWSRTDSVQILYFPQKLPAIFSAHTTSFDL